jgi:hypothetical protein
VSNYSAITNSHNLQFTTACAKSSVCCVFTSCLIMTFITIASSCSVFTSLLANDCLITNSALVGNNLQQWLLCLPCLHQRPLSHNNLRLELVCQPAYSLYTLNSDRLVHISILQIQPLHRPNQKHHSSVDMGHMVSRVHCSGTVCLVLDCEMTPLSAALLLLRDVTIAAVTMCLPSYCLVTAVSAD